MLQSSLFSFFFLFLWYTFAVLPLFPFGNAKQIRSCNGSVCRIRSILDPQRNRSGPEVALLLVTYPARRQSYSCHAVTLWYHDGVTQSRYDAVTL